MTNISFKNKLNIFRVVICIILCILIVLVAYFDCKTVSNIKVYGSKYNFKSYEEIGLLGEGTAENPFKISGRADFELLLNAIKAGYDYAGKYIEQTEDIIFDDTLLDVSEANNSFGGVYDGKGHILKNMHINKDNSSIFGQITTTGFIKNLGVVGGSIKGSGNVSVFGGRLNGKVENCYVYGTSIEANENESTNLTGIVYELKDGSIQNCYFAGTITGGATRFKIANLVSSSASQSVRALNNNFWLENSIRYEASDTGTGYTTSNRPKNNTRNNEPRIDSQFRDGNVLNNLNVFVEDLGVGKGFLYWKLDEETGYPVFTNDSENIKKLKGDGTEDSPYLIEDFSDFSFFLDSMRVDREYSGKYIKQTLDIECTSKVIGMSSVGNGQGIIRNFSGTYDGAGHSLNNLDLAGPACGLFGIVKPSGVIKNLGINYRSFRSHGEVGGGIAAKLDGTIENCYVTGNIKITSPSSVTVRTVGGIFGTIEDNNSATVKNVLFLGTLEGGTSSYSIGRTNSASTLTNAFWKTATYGGYYDQGNFTNIGSKTEEELKSQELLDILNEYASSDSTLSTWVQNSVTEYPIFGQVQEIPAEKKTIKYKVLYYKNGVNITSDTLEPSITVDVTDPDTIEFDRTLIRNDNKYPGYKIEKTIPPDSEIGETVLNGDIISVYYITDEDQRKDITYTIEYYKDNEKFETVSEIVNVQILEEKAPINRELLSDRRYEGYKLDRTNPEIINLVSDGQPISAYYIKDTEWKKEVTCTINYYKDETLVETVDKSKNIYVLDPDEIEIDEDWISNDKYYGYILDKIEPPINQNKVTSGSSISVYYKTDISNKKTLKYTINYYKDNILDRTENRTLEVQVLQPDKIAIDRSLITNENLYEGYRLDRTNPESVEDEVEDKTVIDVYYVSNSLSTKKLKYTVKYCIGNIEVDEETDEITVDISASDLIQVNTDLVTNEEKYTGYKIGSTDPSPIPNEVENGTIITINYIPDESQRKTLSYKIEYYKNNAKVSEITQTARVQVLEPNTLNISRDLLQDESKYPGYKIERTDPIEVPDEVASGSIIKVYYVPDPEQQKTLTYNVIYYKDGVQYGETEIESQDVYKLDPDTITVKKEKLNLSTKIDGYVLERTEPSVIPDTIESGSTIEIYYIKRTDLSYTIHYREYGTDMKLALDKVDSDNTFGDTIEESAIEIEGYDKISPSTVNIDITTGNNEYTFYYKKAKYKYIVEYYYEDIIDPSKTKEYNADYGTTISNYIDETVEGYKLKEDVTPIIISNDESENVLRVYYVIDEETSKKVGYNVIYYKDDLEVSTDTVIKTKVVPKAHTEELAVDKEEINIIDKYDNYELYKIMLNDEEIESIPDAVNSGSIIRIYYKKIKAEIIESEDKSNVEVQSGGEFNETVIINNYYIEEEAPKAQSLTLTSKTSNSTSSNDTSKKSTISNITNTANSKASNPNTGDIIVTIALGALGLIIAINIIQIIIEKVRKFKKEK